MIYKLPRPCNYRVKLQLCWLRIGYNNARRDISLSFYALLTIACLKKEFRGPAHFVNSHYYAVVIRLYFVITRCLSRITRDLAAAWKHRRPMIDGIGNYATNSRTYLPNGLGCVSRLYTHVARKPVAGLKVHVSHPHRNGLVSRARAREFITLLFSRVSEGSTGRKSTFESRRAARLLQRNVKRQLLAFILHRVKKIILFKVDGK